MVETPAGIATAAVPASAVPDAIAAYAEHIHDYVGEYIRLADQKAAFVFSACAALLAFLYQKGVSQRWLKVPTGWGVGDAIAFLAMLGLGAAAFVAVGVIVPRLYGSRQGFFFWTAITHFGSPARYAEAALQVRPADLVRAQLEHTFELSRICRQKYRVLNVSIVFGAVGLYASLLYLLLF